MFNHKWDFAVVFSVGMISSGSGEDVTTSTSLSYGIMGRKRFIIPNNKIKLTLNIGAQLMNTSSGGSLLPVCQ